MSANEIPLSVVVRIVGGGAFLERCLSHLVPQAEGKNIELVVPYDSTIADVRKLASKFPQVIFSEMGVAPISHLNEGTAHQLYDLRISAGLRAARGRIIACIEDFAIPQDDWCEQILLAHQLEHGVIGGAVEHSGHGALNWAVYFLDFERYALPLPEGPAAYVTDVNVSYKRTVLEATRAKWAERYNEVIVHWAMSAMGVTLWQRPTIVVYQDRGALSLKRVLRERFAWGRVFGFMRIRESSLSTRMGLIIASPLIPFVLLGRALFRVLAKKRHRLAFLSVLPLTAVLVAAWSLGELAAYITGREISSPRLAPST